MPEKPPIIRIPPPRGTRPLPSAGGSIGAYEVLGEGIPKEGFLLFEVRHPQLDARRQLKAVSESRVTAELIERLRAVEALSSPFLHRPLESGFDEAYKLYYAVYEKLASNSLRELENYGNFTGEETFSVLLAVSGGLAALEEAGLRHGQLTPERIVFTEDLRQLKLAGLDLLPEEDSGDLFALGEIAYEMVTGRKPSPPDGISGTDPRRCRPGFPGPLAVIIMRLLSTDPMTGFQCAAELESELKMQLSRIAPAGISSLCRAPKRAVPEERTSVPVTAPAAKAGHSSASGWIRSGFSCSRLIIAGLVILLIFTVAARLMMHIASTPVSAPAAFRLSPENQRLKTEQDKLAQELERLTSLRNAWRRNRLEGGK